MLLASFYIDDARITDLAAGEDAGQVALSAASEILGTPATPEKQLPMARRHTFLGL